MRKIFNLCIVLMAISVVVGCDENETTSRDYPRLITSPVSNISLAGATFSAEIIFRGSFEILEYGFVWSTDEVPLVGNSDKVVFSDNIEATSFSANITTTLRHQMIYNVRAYLITENFTVYGNVVEFISLGSDAPAIESFAPTTGGFGDTLTIAGSGFSYLLSTNKVYLGTVPLIGVAATDTLLKFIVPTVQNSATVDLFVEILGNRSQATQKFTYETPVITAAPTEASYQDTIRIMVDGVAAGSTARFDHWPAQVVAIAEGSIDIVVPDQLSTEYPVISVMSNGFVGQWNGFKLKTPHIQTATPDTLTNSNRDLTIYGNFNTERHYTSVKINLPARGSFTLSGADILELRKDRMKIRAGLYIFNNSVTTRESAEVEVNTHSFISNKQVVPLKYDGKWTKKKDFPGAARHAAVGFSAGGKGYFGTGAATNTTGGAVLKDFWEYDPVSDEWTQISDLPGDARWGAVSFTIDNKGYVGLGANFYYGAPDKGFNKDFYYYDPATKSWTKLADFAGIGRHSAASFSVNEKGYVVTGHWGSDYPPDGDPTSSSNETWEYEPLTDAWIKAENFPWILRDGVGFNIGNTGYIPQYSRLVEFRNGHWVQSAFPIESNVNGVAFSIGAAGYFGFGSGYQARIVELKPPSNILTYYWLDYDEGRYDASCFVVGNKAYIIGGLDSDGQVRKDVWEFDPSKPD